MNAKEKAKELVDKYRNVRWDIDTNTAKRCSLIAVDEIINSEKLEYLFSKDEINNMEFTSDSRWINERFTDYWQKVKEEIEKL